MLTGVITLGLIVGESIKGTPFDSVSGSSDSSTLRGHELRLNWNQISFTLT